MYIKLESSIIEYKSRIDKLVKQGFKIVGVEENTIILYKKDNSEIF